MLAYGDVSGAANAQGKTMHNKVIEVADVKRILDSANSDNVRRFCLRILASRAQRLGEYLAHRDRLTSLNESWQNFRKADDALTATLRDARDLLEDIREHLNSKG